MQKKGKKFEQNNNYTVDGMLAYSFRSLFHPSSPDCLFDYSELNLIDFGYIKKKFGPVNQMLDGRQFSLDWSQFKLLDTKQLRLLDSKQFSLLHIPTFVFFMQYLGALSLLLLLNVAIVFGYAAKVRHDQLEDFIRKETTERTRLVYAQQVSNAQAPQHYLMYVNGKSTNDSSVDWVDSKEVYEFDLANASTLEENPRVNGASTEAATETIAFSNEVKCSFKDNVNNLYSNGSSLQISSTSSRNICVNFPQSDSTNYLWKLNSRIASTDTCISISAVSEDTLASFEIYDENQALVGACSISLVN